MAEHRGDRSLLVESILRSDYHPISSEARDQLLDLLASAVNSSDPVVCGLAASRLWYIKDTGTIIQDMIATLLLDNDDHVRLVAAMSAIRTFDHYKDEFSPKIVSILLDAANREVGVSRIQVIECLGKFPHFTDAILPTLVEALDSDDPRERFCASMSLGKFGASASLAVEPLRRAIEREAEYTTGAIDLRIAHAETLFKVIGDNIWSRAAATERLQDPEAPEDIRRGARLLLEMLDKSKGE